jgi:hypothetical protein
MKAPLCLLVLPLLMFGQPAQTGEQTAPPGVEEELVARVKAFYQNFVDGSPRKAEVFVAEDTKDFYYTAQKLRFKSFTVGKVTFSENFTKASVLVVGKTERMLAGQSILMDMPQDTHWKIEDGKWCWTFHEEDYAVTPMGVGGKNPTRVDGSSAPPPKGLTPQAIKEAGNAILANQPMGLDKNAVTLRLDQVSEAKVVFTNDSFGYLDVGLNAPAIRGLKATFDKRPVPPHGQSVLTLHYDPSDKSGPVDALTPKGVINTRVMVMPFQKEFPLALTFLDGK